MSVTITKENINQFLIGSWTYTKIRWRAGPLSAAVLGNFPDLLVLKCISCGLESLAGIEVCTQLQELHCSMNRLTSLAGIENCKQLLVLDCAVNRLTTLVGIESCSNLGILYCWCNVLPSLRGIEGCPRLERIYCHTNRLTDLAGISSCVQLHELQCSDNLLPTLAGIENCVCLSILLCGENRLTTIEHLVYLPHVRYLEVANNLLGAQTIQEQRFIERVDRVNTSRSIYADRQNVHDISIQKTVRDSVQKLLTDPKPKFSIDMVVRSGMDEHAIRLLLEYCDDETVHSQHLLSYVELLSYVWCRIVKSPHKVELLRILGEQILDAECQCFTGRFNRTVSVLVGFYDDIVIEIADSSRIGAVVLAIKERVNPYDPLVHRARAEEELRGLGYSTIEIRPWLEAITESD